MTDASRSIRQALAHHQAGRLREAEALYRSVLQSQPDHPDALHLLGVIAYQSGNFERAVALIRQAIRNNGEAAEYHSNLGNALKECGRLEDAAAACQRALAIKPEFAGAHYNLGLICLNQGRANQALSCLQRALALDAGYADAHNALGIALMELGRIDDAIAAYRRAIALKPGLADAHNNLGIALQAQDRLDEAIACYRHAISLKADYADAWCNLGLACQDQGRIGAACGAYHRALALKPDYAAAHLNHGLALLLQGDFARGWEEYEWRFESARELRALKARFPQQVWRGEDLAGRRILLYSEQGFGDTLQFVRYAPRVAQRGGRVLVECQPELKRLLRSAEGIEAIIGRGEALPEFDVCCPLMSLPRVFGTTLDSIPADIPYLAAEEELVADWAARLEGVPECKVGLVWAGRPTNRTDRRRNCALALFAPLARVSGVRFYSLQKGPAADQARNCPAGLDLNDWTHDIADFAQTAALVANLDLVISVDTAVAHLAGALGKPVWLLSRYDCDWRWLLERADSPWYPGMRIFRQSAPAHWEDVMGGVAAALAVFARLNR